MGMGIWFQRAAPAELTQLKAVADVDRFAFESRDSVGFDKLWHGLHFLLTGTAEETDSPLGIIVCGGEAVGRDYGIGGFWTLSPEEMRAFDDGLRALDDETLVARYDPAAMCAADVYFAEYFVENGERGLDDLLQSVSGFRRFSASCASAGDGAVRGMG